MSALNWLVENWQTIAITVTSIIGAASMAVAAIAPLTKTDTDDKVLSILSRAHKWLSKLALNPKT